MIPPGPALECLCLLPPDELMFCPEADPVALYYRPGSVYPLLEARHDLPEDEDL